MSEAAPARILVVDDVDYNRDILARILARDGHVVVAAGGGREALAVLAAEPFDLVLLDVMMPEMDGIQVMAAIHQDERLRHLPVVMLSALNDQESIVKCLKLGAEDYLPKPINQSILNARIFSCLERKRLQDLEKAHVEGLEALRLQLHQSNEDLQQANQIKSRFLATAAHDLKNPLTSILLASDLARAEANPANAARLQRIGDEGRKMLQIINSLLETTAQEIRDITLHLEESNLPNLVHQVVTANLDYAQSKDLRLTYEELLAGECWGFVDEVHFKQAVDNLVNNAIKYSPPGRKVEVILAPRIVDGQTWLELQVRDEGPGLTAEDQARAFGLYQRLSAKPTGGEYSTGLGLSIVKTMVELHGGHVWIESEVGHGATFCLDLPLRTAPGAATLEA